MIRMRKTHKSAAELTKNPTTLTLSMLALGGFCRRGLMSGGILTGGSCPGGF